MKPRDRKVQGTLPFFPESDNGSESENAFLDEMQPELSGALDETDYRNQADGFFQ
jgi:hypothetical protein